MQGFPRSSYYGVEKKAAPAPKKEDTFEAEFQKFVEEQKAKKEAEVLTETPKEEAPIIPETVVTVAEDAPVLNEETQPKKKKKKKEETVAE
jgi:hypothetical protein